MPEVTAKTQPWKAHWPPPASVNNKDGKIIVKAGEVLEVDGTQINGSYGYNDNGEGVPAPKVENGRRRV